VSDEEPAETTPAPARPKKKKRRRPEADAPIERAIDADEPAPRRQTGSDRGWLMFGILPWFAANLWGGRARAGADAGPRIPAFALGFPADPELDALVAAFEQGDYARVRREAPALVKATESVAVRKATRELLKRIEPDPIAVYLLAGAALLLTFLAFWYWTHPHASP
jgi:hypothetical protein